MLAPAGHAEDLYDPARHGFAQWFAGGVSCAAFALVVLAAFLWLMSRP